MKKKLIIATGNINKVKEIKQFFGEINWDIQQVGGHFDPKETGKTFEENAYIKACEAAKQTGEIALGDDSGLLIDALDGAPGLYSSRYADTSEARIERVIKELAGVPKEKRKAHFACAMVICDPSGNILFSCEGRCDGFILEEQKGVNGFGYDPIFYISEYDKTMAELDSEVKNSISHRANALKQVQVWLKA